MATTRAVRALVSTHKTSTAAAAMPSKQAAKQQYATMAAAKRDIKALFEAASRGDTKTVEGTKDLDKYKGRPRALLPPLRGGERFG